MVIPKKFKQEKKFTELFDVLGLTKLNDDDAFGNDAFLNRGKPANVEVISTGKTPKVRHGIPEELFKIKG